MFISYKCIYLCVCVCVHYTCLYTRYKRVSYIDLNGSPGHAKYPSGSRSPPGPAILPLKGVTLHAHRPARTVPRRRTPKSPGAAAPRPRRHCRHCRPRAHRSFACNNINSRKILYIILRVYNIILVTPTQHYNVTCVSFYSNYYRFFYFTIMYFFAVVRNSCRAPP